MSSVFALGQGYRDIGWVHRALLAGATAGARLEFFVDDNTGATTPLHRLRLPPVGLDPPPVNARTLVKSLLSFKDPFETPVEF